MRHGLAGHKLKRGASARRALLRNLATSVIDAERIQIQTTIPKAKAIKPIVEKLITLGKKDDLNARRQAASYLMTTGAVEKLFDKLGPRFSQRNGGYSRIRATRLAQGRRRRSVHARTGRLRARQARRGAPQAQ